MSRRHQLLVAIPKPIFKHPNLLFQFVDLHLFGAYIGVCLRGNFGGLNGRRQPASHEPNDDAENHTKSAPPAWLDVGFFHALILPRLTRLVWPTSEPLAAGYNGAMSEELVQRRQRRAALRLVYRCLLLALALPCGLVAILAGGCAMMEPNTEGREAFVFWGALKVLAVSGTVAALSYWASRRFAD
jgi:hypothetical protein